MAKKTDKSLEQRRQEIAAIAENLNILLKFKNNRELSQWFAKDENNINYIKNAITQGALNYEKLIDRCKEDSIDINIIVGNKKIVNQYKERLELDEKTISELTNELRESVKTTQKMLNDFSAIINKIK
jgi:hypothetical protein